MNLTIPSSNIMTTEKFTSLVWISLNDLLYVIFASNHSFELASLALIVQIPTHFIYGLTNTTKVAATADLQLTSISSAWNLTSAKVYVNCFRMVRPRPSRRGSPIVSSSTVIFPLYTYVAISNVSCECCLTRRSGGTEIRKDIPPRFNRVRAIYVKSWRLKLSENRAALRMLSREQ